jgi:hypothetical protein
MVRQQIFCSGLTRAAKAGQKSLVATQWAQRTNQGRTPWVLLESPFASVSTVSGGHPSLVSLATYPFCPEFIALAPLSKRVLHQPPWCGWKGTGTCDIGRQLPDRYHWRHTFRDRQPCTTAFPACWAIVHIYELAYDEENKYFVLR